jgi:hypothetical protein
MKLVGFEPTTSAQKQSFLTTDIIISKMGGFNLIDKVEVAIAYKV